MGGEIQVSAIIPASLRARAVVSVLALFEGMQQLSQCQSFVCCFVHAICASERSSCKTIVPFPLLATGLFPAAQVHLFCRVGMSSH